MDTFIRIQLVLHIIAGFAALIAGFVASVTAKGQTRHRQSGRIYFWAMTVVFITATVIGVVRERWFLFMVGFFSYYLVVRGYRILYQKKLGAGQNASWLDWSIVTIAMSFGASLVVWSFLSGSRGLSIVALVFGVICVGFAGRDIQLFVRGPSQKNHWIFGHITSMASGYIATWTAFVVTNVNFMPPVVVWLGPTAIGTVCIAYTIQKYRRKMARPARPAVAPVAAG
jgi:uncharacterized membrane protein